MVEERSKNKQANLFGGYSSSSSSKVGYNDDSGAETEGASDNVFGASGSSAYMSDSDILSIQAPPVPAKSAGRPRENRFPSRVFGWGLGRVGMERTAPIAVWMEMRRVGLAPKENIPLRCGFDSSLKIWRTELLQPGWLTSASPVALSVFSVRCARDSPRRPSPARRVAHLRPPAPAHLLLLRPRWARPRRPIFFFPGCGAPFPGGVAPDLVHRGLAA